MERATNRFGILAFHALIWTLPFGLFYAFEQPSVSQRFYFQVAMTTIALFYLAAGALAGSLRAPRNGVLGAAVLYGVCVTASALVARSPLFTIKETTFVWCGILLLAIIAHVRLTRGQSRRLLGSYVLIAGAIALYGVLQYLGLNFRLGRFGYSQDIQDGRFHVLSLLGHPNYLTAYIGPALLLVPGLVATTPSRRWQAALAAVAGIILLCIFVSGTRSAWLATLLLGGAMAVMVASAHITFQFGRRARIALLVASGVLVLFVVHNPVLRHRYSFVDRLMDSRPVEGRLYFYLAATRMIGRHPILGVGYNNYGVQFGTMPTRSSRIRRTMRTATCSKTLAGFGPTRLTTSTSRSPPKQVSSASRRFFSSWRSSTGAWGGATDEKRIGRTACFWPDWQGRPPLS